MTKRRPIAAVAGLAAISLMASAASWAGAPPNIAPPAQAAPLSPAPRMVQSYRLGLAAYRASAAVVAMDRTIKLGKPSLPEMSALADQTRKAELDAYHDAVGVLKSMGAPEPVVTPFINAVDTLTAPVVVTDQAKDHVGGDLAALKVWSTLDEAERIAPSDGSGLTAWLKLSRGRDGLWAYHLGELIAVLRAAVPGKPSEWPVVDTASQLAASAPAATPEKIVAALANTGEQARRGKLSSDDAKAVDQAVSNVFGGP